MGDVAELRAAGPAGELVGHVGGHGPEVLLLHGGPMSDYTEPLAEELRDSFRVATYQQRGLAPSTTDGPFDVATHVADVVAVLDTLGWRRPVVAGHSWGGNLLLHLLTAHPDRVAAALLLDTLGGVDDGGFGEFDAEMQRRTPAAARARAAELDEQLMAGTAPDDVATESVRLYWPAYFPDPESAPPFPDIRVSAEMTGGTLASAVAELPALAGRLRRVDVPTTFVHGGRSPMPLTAATDTAAVLGDRAEVVVVDGAGHFPWLDVPGCVRGPLADLVRRAGD